MIYAELVTVAAIVVYIVGVSGFTQSWRGVLAGWVHLQEHQLRPLKPFDCPTCMVFWSCLGWSLYRGSLGLWTVAEAAGLSLLAIPIQDFLLFIREGLCAALRRLFEKL